MYTYYVIQKFSSRYLPKKNEDIRPYKDFPVNDYGRFLHNIPKVKATMCRP